MMTAYTFLSAQQNKGAQVYPAIHTLVSPPTKPTMQSILLVAVGTYSTVASLPSKGQYVVFDKDGQGRIFAVMGIVTASMLNTDHVSVLSAFTKVQMISIRSTEGAVPFIMTTTGYILDKVNKTMESFVFVDFLRFFGHQEALLLPCIVISFFRFQGAEWFDGGLLPYPRVARLLFQTQMLVQTSTSSSSPTPLCFRDPDFQQL
jgi:hypothetical protein